MTDPHTTPHRVDLLALAERIEKAGGPDLELNVDIAKAVGLSQLLIDRMIERGLGPASYTGCSDAAFGLLPEGIAFIEMRLSWDTNRNCSYPAVSIRWYPPGKSGSEWHALVVTAKTIPLTICAAAMTLRAHTGGSSHGRQAYV